MIFIKLFYVFLIAAGLTLLIKPEVLIQILQRYKDHWLVYASAVIVRLLIGVLLLVYSAKTSSPHLILVLGWVFIAAGVVLALMGQQKFRQLLGWVLERFASHGRLGGVFAVVFGVFLMSVFR